MASGFIGIDVTGIKELQERLDKLPEAVGDAGVETVNVYLLNVMRANAPYQYVTRKAAYGKTFFTAKQRRWFFAALHDGRLQIPYRRTQALSRGWRVLGTGRNQIIVNERPGAEFVRGVYPGEQSRHEHKVGWIPVNEELTDRAKKILEHFEEGVRKAIKKLGLA